LLPDPARREVCAAETDHEGAGGVEDAVFAVDFAARDDGARIGEREAWRLGFWLVGMMG
jgi:hypothetical protein